MGRKVQAARDATREAEAKAREYRVKMFVAQKQCERAVADLEAARDGSGQWLGKEAWLQSELEMKLEEIDRAKVGPPVWDSRPPARHHCVA
jgi:hypothetical protein